MSPVSGSPTCGTEDSINWKRFHFTEERTKARRVRAGRALLRPPNSEEMSLDSTGYLAYFNDSAKWTRNEDLEKWTLPEAFTLRAWEPGGSLWMVSLEDGLRG